MTHGGAHARATTGSATASRAAISMLSESGRRVQNKP
jgi:hypothetical protein